MKLNDRYLAPAVLPPLVVHSRYSPSSVCSVDTHLNSVRIHKSAVTYAATHTHTHRFPPLLSMFYDARAVRACVRDTHECYFLCLCSWRAVCVLFSSWLYNNNVYGYDFIFIFCVAFLPVCTHKHTRTHTPLYSRLVCVCVLCWCCACELFLFWRVFRYHRPLSWVCGLCCVSWLKFVRSSLYTLH